MSLIFYWIMNPINDITTRFEPPISFEVVQEWENHPAQGSPKKFQEIQRKLHPEIKPLFFEEPPEKLYQVALQAAKSYSSWKIEFEDAEKFVIQGTDTTSLMNYIDDFVIRIESVGENKSEIHMRSKSRVGKSDLGKNANRIQNFFTKMKKSLGS